MLQLPHQEKRTDHIVSCESGISRRPGTAGDLVLSSFRMTLVDGEKDGRQTAIGSTTCVVWSCSSNVAEVIDGCRCDSFPRIETTVDGCRRL